MSIYEPSMSIYEPSMSIYEPSMSIFERGRKRIILGETEYMRDSSSFLISSIDVPRSKPDHRGFGEFALLVMFLRFDMPVVRELLTRDDIPEAKATEHRQGLAVGQTTLKLLRACHRLLDLLETPEDIAFLSPLIKREMIYRLLKTPQAARLRAIATGGDLS